MKTIIMRTQKSSRLTVMLVAAVVAIVTSTVVADTEQTLATPNKTVINYSLAPGANSAAITPMANQPVLVMGCCTTLGFRGVGHVTLLHVPSSFIEWGLNSTSGASITDGVQWRSGDPHRVHRLLPPGRHSGEQPRHDPCPQCQYLECGLVM